MLNFTQMLAGNIPPEPPAGAGRMHNADAVKPKPTAFDGQTWKCPKCGEHYDRHGYYWRKRSPDSDELSRSPTWCRNCHGEAVSRRDIAKRAAARAAKGGA